MRTVSDGPLHEPIVRASERKLVTERSFAKALTRVADKVALVLDDVQKVERHVTRRTANKTLMFDMVARLGA